MRRSRPLNCRENAPNDTKTSSSRSTTTIETPWLLRNVRSRFIALASGTARAAVEEAVTQLDVADEPAGHGRGALRIGTGLLEHEGDLDAAHGVALCGRE